MIPLSENVKDWLLIYGVIYFIANTVGGFYLKRLNSKLNKLNNDLHKLNTSLYKTNEEAIRVATESYAREIYLMKALNDSLKVVDMRGFLKQRMENAPSSWKPLSQDDVKPDKVS